MGNKGDRKSGDAKLAAEQLVAVLAPIGPVTSRGMFGGQGIFMDGVMFGLVNTAGTIHFRVNDETSPDFEAAGGERHGKMPYYSVPDSVLDDSDNLCAWAAEAAAIAKASKKK